MIPKVREWIERQGFALELRTASAFRHAGFEVRQSTHYIDPETRKDREIDVVARDPDVIGVIDIVVVVECKSSTKPWVVLSSPDVLDGYNRLLAFGLLSQAATEFIANRTDEFVASIPWSRKGGLVGYSARQAFIDSDNAFAASMSVAKACDFWIGEARRPELHRIVFPVIVVDAPILLCSLNEGGELTLAEVDEAEFLFTAELQHYRGSCIRMVSARRVAAFALEAKVTADAIRTYLKPAEQDVVASWKAPGGGGA